MRGYALSLLVLLLLSLLSSSTYAQQDFGAFQFDGFGDVSDPVSVSAQWTAATDDRPAVLMITAEMEPSWHIYSITQPKGGPLKSEITLKPSDDYRLLGDFRPFPEPKSHVDQVAWKGLTIEEHYDQVTWYVPIEVENGTPTESLTIKGNIRVQACKEQCLAPTKYEFTAGLGEGVPIGPMEVSEPAATPKTAAAAAPRRDLTPPDNAGVFRAEGSVVTWYAWLEPSAAAAGGEAELHLQAQMEPNWHVFAYAEQDAAKGSKPTLIALDAEAPLALGRPATSSPIIEHDTGLPLFGVQRYHESGVTWTVPIKIAADSEPGTYPLEGLVGYQACESSESGGGMCELVRGMKVIASVAVGDAIDAQPRSVTLQPASYRAAAGLAARTADTPPPAESPTTQATTTTTAVYDLSKITFGGAENETLLDILLYAFIGGLVLNIMPCVLPVIGLKVMSFVEQSGHSRGRALALNIWYSLGIISVFWVLAGLAIFAGLTWGGQFGSVAFNAVMIGVVFAMALSLLGVWEIPIPGFIGSGTAQKISQQEGPLGAFLKGVVTTLLATPCTGPGMAIALAWAIRQTPTTILLTFTAIGIGMASPYLLIGAFPSLVRWIPKPGNWMITFKQLMGFVLIGTAVFLLFALEPAAVPPVLVLLLGISIACWWIARTPIGADTGEHAMAWVTASSIITAFAVFSFAGLYQHVTLPRQQARLSQLALDSRAQATNDILAKIAAADSLEAVQSHVAAIKSELVEAGAAPWQPFSLERLGELTLNQGRTVLVDFSAEWCANCKVLEATVLHTEPVEQAIEQNNVVTMYADFTDYPPEIKQAIEALQSNGVPVIAVFPGDRPYEPYVFRGAYTQQQLIDAIEQAVPDARSNVVAKAAFEDGMR